ESGALPVAAMADGEIVVQVTPHAEAIKQAYLLVKQLHGQLGRRSFSVLVTNASEKDSQRVLAHLAQTASRYLAVELRMIGAVPADEHLSRAVTLERPVVEAFPLAAASVAFRQIASWFAQQGSMYARRESWTGQEPELVLAGAQDMYTAQGKTAQKDLLTPYAPLVKKLAHQMKAKLPPSVEVDDLIQAGMIGLLDACGRYEDTHGAQFETYAVQRIRGSMLDELRSNDWMPRSMRQNMRKVEAA